MQKKIFVSAIVCKNFSVFFKNYAKKYVINMYANEFQTFEV